MCANNAKNANLRGWGSLAVLPDNAGGIFSPCPCRRRLKASGDIRRKVPEGPCGSTTGIATVTSHACSTSRHGTDERSNADMLRDDAPEFEHPAPGSTFSQTPLFTPAISSG